MEADIEELRIEGLSHRVKQILKHQIAYLFLE